MFLIEADDKRIWNTGDYREHGYMGKGLITTLKKYATNIDTLITEGTMLNRDDKCIHEREVSAKMTNMMCTFIERLAAIKEAANKSDKAIYVCSKFMKQTMAFFTDQEGELSHGLFSFHPKFYNQRLLKSVKRNGMVMIAGSSQKECINGLINELPQEETLLIYSSWDGYYKDPVQIKVNPMYKEFREMFHNVVDIHTSGHADRKTIEKVIRTINPKRIICIHKEADAEL